MTCQLSMAILIGAVFGTMCNAHRLELSILSFGGKADGVTNNQAAIKAALRACEANGAAGCTLTFPVPAQHAPVSPPPYHPWGPPPVAVFRTSAFNLTSHLRLVIAPGVQLRGTEDFADNCGGRDHTTCDDWDSPSWPILPSLTYPSAVNKPGPPAVKQAFIRGYNLTDVEITGGGEIHGGGGWWWCARMLTAKQPAGGHAPKWCSSMVAAGLIPTLTSLAPHMLHLIGTRNVVVSNITISNSPSWTVHFQYCDNVTLSHSLVFNPNNGSIEAPNADGIDVDSSSNVHVHDCIFDVGDDMLCVKSGADYWGRRTNIPSRNVLFERVEVRNGHGLTLGSEASGGLINITYRDIFINGVGGPQAPGLRKRPGAVGGIHFKTGRGRGGHWENITYERIYGNNAVGLFGFTENHGSSYDQRLGPTNATGTPTITNLHIKDVALTDVRGPAVIFTLAEAPIRNFTLSNVTWEPARGVRAAYQCTGWQGKRQVEGLFATGFASDVRPPLNISRGCKFLTTSLSSTSAQ